MRISKGLQRSAFDEPVFCYLLILFWQFGNRQTQVIQLIEVRQQLRCFSQRDLLHAWDTGEFLDRLVHSIEAGPCEVCPWVGQLLGIVRFRCLHQGEVAL